MASALAALLRQIVSETLEVNHRHFLIDDELAQPHRIHDGSHDSLMFNLVAPSAISRLTRLLLSSRPSSGPAELDPKSIKADVCYPQPYKSSVYSFNTCFSGKPYGIIVRVWVAISASGCAHPYLSSAPTLRHHAPSQHLPQLQPHVPSPRL